MAVSENRVYLRGMAILKANMTINQWTTKGASVDHKSGCPIFWRSLTLWTKSWTREPKLGDGHQAMFFFGIYDGMTSSHCPCNLTMAYFHYSYIQIYPNLSPWYTTLFILYPLNIPGILHGSSRCRQHSRSKRWWPPHCGNGSSAAGQGDGEAPRYRELVYRYIHYVNICVYINIYTHRIHVCYIW